MPGGGAQYIFADQIGGAASCGASAAKATSTGLAAAPYMALADFPDPTTTFGNQMRNQNRGPGYFNTDFALEKAFEF